jgi:hypothetical protein
LPYKAEAVSKAPVSSLQVFISGEQTKETDGNIGSLFFVIAELLSETQGAVSKALILRHCEEERRSNPVIFRYFRIASLRSQ